MQQDFGDLTNNKSTTTGFASSTKRFICWWKEIIHTYINILNLLLLQQQGNATDFGDLTGDFNKWLWYF